MSIETTTSPARPIRETLDERVSALVHAEWATELPWLVQGTTTRGAPGEELDLGLFSGGSADAVVQRSWERLLARTAMPAAMHAHQLHETEVRWHASARSGLGLVGPCDGHATDQAGVLLAVSIADCVPVFAVATGARAVAAIHAGWRGTAAGVLERGLGLLAQQAAAHVSGMYVHFGPAICGSCYEVGPEVFTALGLPAPPARRPIDLRSVLAARAVALGVDRSRITTSEHCTRCTGSGLFSHRGGDLGRQVGYIGVRP
jgi:polyphenol oxidase